MFDRIMNSLALQQFNRAVERMNEQEKKELELEYEKLTGMECDEAAQLQTNEQFVETMKQAYKNTKRRNAKEIHVMEIYT